MLSKTKIIAKRVFAVQVEDWEKWLIGQYQNHPTLSRFSISVILVTLSLVQHILEKYGYLQDLSAWVGQIAALITKFFLPGGL